MGPRRDAEAVSINLGDSKGDLRLEIDSQSTILIMGQTVQWQ